MTTVRGVPVDYTSLGYEALRSAMLDIAERTLPEWTDRSENDLGVLLIELMAYASDVTMYYQTRIAQQLFPGSADDPAALVPLLRLLGYELRPPAVATADLAISVDAATPLPLTVPAGTGFVVELPSGDQIRFETVRTQLIADADLGPVETGNVRRFTPLPVAEGRTVTGEVIGRSDGSPSQLCPLAQSPAIAGSISATVAEPGGATVWREVTTMVDATPVDRVFVVQRDATGTARLLFGDGVNGRIPPAGTASAPADITATYRVGGGPQGNVPAGTRLTSAVAEIREATAPAGGRGGTPAESIERATGFAPRLFRSQDRAVTAQDYVDLALGIPGIGKAVAVATGWNGVDLYVAPSGSVSDPGELLRRDVLAAFEPTRMLTTEITVHGPQPVDIYLRAVVRAEPYVLADDVRQAVEQAVGVLLAFDAVDFGQPIYLSRVYDAAQSLPTVASLTVTQFSRDPDGAVDADGVIELGPFELARPGYQPTILVTLEGGVVR
jgi:Baseplate J-like protein